MRFHDVRRPSIWLLALVAAAVLIVSAVRIGRDLPSYNHIVTNSVSGTWAALAVDVKDGELYRPLVAEDGYGGTRYFPLHFVLHGALMKVGLGPVAAGHLISLASLIAIMLAVYVLLRRMGVERALAACACSLWLALNPEQGAIVDIRGDLLPAALNLWGIAVFLVNRRRLTLVSVLFVLAFLAKMTTVFGAVAVLLAMLFAGERRVALWFAGRIALGSVVGLVIIYVASGGRLIDSMTAVASGGSSISQILLRVPQRVIEIVPPSNMILAALGLGVVASLPREERREVLPLAVLTTGFITMVLFGSPGVDANHLIDFDVIAIVFITASVSRGRIALPHVAVGMTFIAALSMAVVARVGFVPPQRPVIEKVIAETTSGTGPLLAENPWWAILAGERPFLLDAFNLRIISEHRPEVARDLHARLDAKYFRAVILGLPLDEPEFVWGTLWYGDVHFDKGFAEHLTANYDLVATYPAAYSIQGYFVWRPKPPRANAPAK